MSQQRPPGGQSEPDGPYDILRIGPSDPTIRQVISAYHDVRHPHHNGHLPQTTRLLETYLDEWGHLGLSLPQEDLLARFWNAEGTAHRAYCDFFGPDSLLDELEFFFGCYLSREVPVRAREMAGIAEDLTRFVEWLAEGAYVPGDAARRATAVVRAAPATLARAERAVRLLGSHSANAQAPVSGKTLMVHGDFTLRTRRLGHVWLQSSDDGAIYGPVTVPPDAYDLLEERWELTGTVGYARRRWRLLEVGNVYPEYAL